MSALLNHARRSPLLSWLLDNPLLVREIRRRMRGRLFSWSLILYVLALGGVSMVIMLTSYPAAGENLSLRDLLEKVGRIGESLFGAMRALEMIIALGVAPLLTAGLATSEKEKDTFDFLRVTTLRAGTFVGGCLLTTGCFLLLVFCCTLPVMGLTFIFGGISLNEVLGFNLALFLGAMAICSGGIFISTNYQRSVSVLGSVAAVFLLGILISGSSMIRYFFGPGAGLFSPFNPGGWLPAALMLGGPLVVTLILAVGAARRLYEPNARIYNYKQVTAFFLITLGAIAGAGLRAKRQVVAVPGTDLAGFAMAFALTGALICALSVLILSAGRIERGDEVWRIRLRSPLFQRLPDDLLVHLFMASVWIGGTFALGRALALPAADLDWLNLVLVTAGPALVLAYSVSRCMSGFFESRNRAMIAAGLVLMLVWGVAPIMGAVGAALMKEFGWWSGSGLVQRVFDLMISLSPGGALHLQDTTGGAAPAFTASAQLLLATLFLLPTRAASWRERMSVSYHWIEAPSQRS